MLLDKILSHRVTCYHESFDSWQEAIVACGQPLLKEGFIDESYIDEIIKCVSEYGPYIVIAPNIAMPHSTLGNKGVHRSTIGFMKTKQPVVFDPNDREKDACLFFTLASNQPEEHLENMVALSEMLMNEALVEDLLQVENDEDLKQIAKKYPNN